MKKCVKHELVRPRVVRTRSFIFEQGTCRKCGARGHFETKNVNGTEKRVWTRYE